MASFQRASYLHLLFKNGSRLILSVKLIQVVRKVEDRNLYR